MGAEESKSGNRSDGDDDGEEWMQADKYAEWECSDHMDYNGTAISIQHLEMPFNRVEKERLMENKAKGLVDENYSSPFTHEALVFEVLCLNGMRTKFTVELTYAGVLKRWGHHKVIMKVKGHKAINVPMTQLLEKIKYTKPYNVITNNCKHYAALKFKEF